jgi:hypothetical protein
MSDWDQVLLKTLYETETWPTPFKWRSTYCCKLHELAVNMVDKSADGDARQEWVSQAHWQSNFASGSNREHNQSLTDPRR